MFSGVDSHMRILSWTILTVITSVLSLVFQAAGHPTVFVSGLLGTILAPYAAIQQRKLTEVEALAETNERLTSEVDQLATENERLSTQVQTMEKSVAKYVDTDISA
jgi:cell shape-determining protein MreC